MYVKQKMNTGQSSVNLSYAKNILTISIKYTIMYINYSRCNKCIYFVCNFVLRFEYNGKYRCIDFTNQDIFPCMLQRTVYTEH